MRCVYCNHVESKVVDSRPTDDNWAIRRRRECINCGKRFTTYEKIENPMILVIKKDGRREPFNTEKIRAGLIKACEKRPVTAQDIDEIVSQVEKEVLNTLEQEVTSHQIGEMIMEKLKNLDQVAYVRFASVYRQFRDINTFRDELNKLLGD
ncbi:MAG: transcriptional regulator NrdR [Christensenellales bacterium]